MPSSTPIYGFPYPLGTDPVGQGAQDIEDLATAVENYLDKFQGLIKVIPSSATNGTVDALGNVSVTSGSSIVTVNGVFSSTYDSYRIVIDRWRQSTDAVLNVCMGTAFTGTAHVFGGVLVTTAGVVSGVGNGGGTSIYGSIHAAATQMGGGVIDVFNPNQANRTSIITGGPDPRSGTTIPYRAAMGFVNDNTQYTAFSLNASAGTITEMRIKVYGYNQ